MRNLLRGLPLIAILFVVTRADESLAHARRAQALLGDDVWSQVVRIENVARESVYPRSVHALVFEFAGRLWFYCSVDGTQSFSVYAGRLAEDKADFGPLLREIEPGFRRWTTLPKGPAAPGPLRNACFIESLAALRARIAAGVPVSAPQLLSYYVDTPAGRRGHTVLVYRVGGRTVAVDPARPALDFSFSDFDGSEAIALAREFEGPDVAKARLIAIPLPEQPAVSHIMAAR